MSELDSKRYILVDGILENEDNFSVELNSRDEYAYEVVRLIDGKPLFLEEHIERLDRTLAGLELENTITVESAKKDFAKLCEANHRVNDNVKILIQNGHTYMKFARMIYPANELYDSGVVVGIISAVRLNPQAKISNYSLREMSDRIIQENGYAEVLLADNSDCITEGSRSNVFFIKDGVAYTCPPEGVLLGITRKRIMAVCEANGISVEFKQIERSELADFDAAFISGTSPKVLPIRMIKDEKAADGKVEYSTNDSTLRQIMKLYDDEIEDYLKD